MKFRLFISSVQKEFAKERRAIASYIRKDAVLRSPNKLIATPMYLKGYIEKMGTGTEDVAKLCARNGLSAPSFAEGVDFRAVLKRKPLVGVAMNGSPLNFPSNDTVNDTVNGTAGSLKSSLKSSLKRNLNATDRIIITEIRKNRLVTIPQLQEHLSLSRNGIKKALGRLRVVGLIRRVDPDKGGHWEVVEGSGE